MMGMQAVTETAMLSSLTCLSLSLCLSVSVTDGLLNV